MDCEHHQGRSPGSLCLHQHPCANLSCSSAMTYIRAAETHEHSRLISSSQSSQVCTKHGVNERSLSSMHPLKSTESHVVGGIYHPLQVYHAGNTAETRLYRSLENLNWASVSDSSVYTHFRSVDSEFILHCRSTRHLSGGSAGKAPVHSMTEIYGNVTDRLAAPRDTPVPPIAKIHQWLFSTGDDKVAPGDAKRELKEKLRNHSSKTVEPNRPVRPLTFPASCLVESRLCQSCSSKHCSTSPPETPVSTKSTMPASRQCTSFLHQRTNPEYIKQEAIRRLQLRRQNSSPNLTLLHADKENRGLVKSKTTESFREQRQCPGRQCEAQPETKHSGKHRFYIPTFEEFKNMRSREKESRPNSEICLENKEFPSKNISKTKPNTNGCLPITAETQHHKLGNGTIVSVPDSTGATHGEGDMMIVQDRTSMSRGEVDSMMVHSHTGMSQGDSMLVQECTSASHGHRDSKIVQDPTDMSHGQSNLMIGNISTDIYPGDSDSILGQNSTTTSHQEHNSAVQDTTVMTYRDRDLIVQDDTATSHQDHKSIVGDATGMSIDNCDSMNPSQSKLPLNDRVPCHRAPLIAQHGSLESRGHSPPYRPTFPAPICSSPVPRFPLQSMHSAKEELELCDPHVFNASRSSGLPCLAEHSVTSEAHSSCCPSLLLEATDLSSYGAKLQKVKNGLIGSALDLIKKSCSAETAIEPPAGASRDLEKIDRSSQGNSNQSSACFMATQSCTTTTSDEMATDPKSSLSISGCRRSSSDMTHEVVDAGKSQRGCRLRPHFSDPMPTDAVKRKQLEMKIAAAARHHSQRRRQDKDNGPVLMKANTTTSCSSGKDRSYTAGEPRRSRHRWSNISSLSTDSGIVGVNDEREEGEGSITRAPKPGEVERVDSGIGDALSRRWRARVAEAAASLEAWEAHRPCTDCGERDSALDTESRGKRRETLCSKCVNRRMERKEAVMEFVNTEASYGEDLRIIKEEFYLPMQMAGLLTHEQLQVVFSNIQELIDLNDKFLEVLQEEIDQAFDQGDDDLMTFCIGEVFLEFVNMLPAFQTYCLQQPTSVTALNALEKEKELLRIFLDVSQNDNMALRRMNLRSFLMAPLQRVTKYPLLLSRILKSTTEFHPDHSSLWEAKSRIESHLEHINMKTKQEGNTWTLRSFRRESRKNREVTNIEMRELAIKQVGWPREETRFIKEGPLQLAQPADGQWVKKGCKALKFQNVQVLLMVKMRRPSESSLEGNSSESQAVRDAVLVIIKDKSNGKFAMLGEPLRLGHCVVSADPECEDTFELLEIRREGFVFRDGDNSRTHHWYRQIKTYSRQLGSWKKRRNALPNIMISTTQSRS
ncbi:uncharacterized protein WCC33_014352 isoform 1-T1 [Rhinophrynus dorsalis]